MKRAEIDALIAETRRRLDMGPEFRSQWDEGTVRQLVGVITELLFTIDGEGCICDGGPQGEGCVSIPHEPHCPLSEKER